MNNNTCANCAHWGDGNTFSTYGMDFCCREDSGHYNELMNSDSYCKAWEQLAECAGCIHWDGDDGRCRNANSADYMKETDMGCEAREAEDGTV